MRGNAAIAKMREWRESPNAFVRQVLGIEPDGWQDEVLENVARWMRVALKASKGPGKTALLAMIAWWFLFTRLHPKVVGTSITADNLRDGLWTELSKFQKRSELLKREFTWTAERVFQNQHPETWWASARTWSRSASPEQQADTLAGVHADHVLFLVDESGGIPDAVVAAAEGGLANADSKQGTEAKLIIAGNPTELSGPLYRACTRERHLWWVKEISGDPDDPNRAPRVSKEWAREQIEKYGRDNPWVLVNVFGQFPPGQANTLVAADVANGALRRSAGESEYTYEPRVLGVDVARFGDDRSVIFPRQGRVAFRPKTYRNLNLMELVGQVVLTIDRWKPDAVFVDVTGMGAGVVDRLRELGHVVIGVDFGSRPVRPEPKFRDRRAEMWWSAAEWLTSGGCLPDVPELVGELTAPTYRFDSSGRLCLEPKDELKKRGLPSPDLADALALTFAAPVVKLNPIQALERRYETGATARGDYDPFAEGRV